MYRPCAARRSVCRRHHATGTRRRAGRRSLGRSARRLRGRSRRAGRDLQGKPDQEAAEHEGARAPRAARPRHRLRHRPVASGNRLQPRHDPGAPQRTARARAQFVEGRRVLCSVQARAQTGRVSRPARTWFSLGRGSSRAHECAQNDIAESVSPSRKNYYSVRRSPSSSFPHSENVAPKKSHLQAEPVVRKTTPKGEGRVGARPHIGRQAPGPL